PFGELQHLVGATNVEAADQVEHDAGLVGRRPHVLGGRLRAMALTGPVLVDGRALVELGTTHQRRAPFSCPAWNRNVRVGLNSPSLWPTIDSVMYTGTCLRPSCTARVWPTMSGMMVERRDQVLMTLRSPAAFCSSTFLSKCSSTKGPFLRLRVMIYSGTTFRDLSDGPCRCG